MSKHTPGPLTVGDYGEPDYLDGIECQYSVKAVSGEPFPVTTAYVFEQADAVIYAAAPDLLEAAEAVARADRLNISEWNEAMRLVDAALAKARGEVSCWCGREIAAGQAHYPGGDPENGPRHLPNPIHPEDRARGEA